MRRTHVCFKYERVFPDLFWKLSLNMATKQLCTRVIPYYGNYFLRPKIWHRGKRSINVWKHVACTCECYHQMGVYIQEPLLGGKQITRVLNHVFLLFYCGVQSENVTKNRENRKGVAILPTPQRRRTFLTVFAVWAVALPCRMMAFYGIPFSNDVVSTVMFAQYMRLHGCTYTPTWW
jgi:hypothetical protein